jgi:hypothetical protein
LQSVDRSEILMPDKTPSTPSPEQAMPRWVKRSIIAVVAVALLILGMFLIVGGDHGPGRHGPGNHGAAPAAGSS